MMFHIVDAAEPLGPAVAQSWGACIQKKATGRKVRLHKRGGGLVVRVRNMPASVDRHDVVSMSCISRVLRGRVTIAHKRGLCKARSAVGCVSGGQGIVRAAREGGRWMALLRQQSEKTM